MPADEEYHTSAMVDAVREMTAKLEQHTRSGDAAREQLQHTVEGIVASMRTDVHKAILSLQLTQADHKTAHEADRMERSTRQIQVDAQLSQIRNWLIGMLIGIVAIGAFLVGWLVF
jgi:hypothetical protein